MKYFSLACLAAVMMGAAARGADEPDASDRADRRRPLEQRRFENVLLPPPLQAFDVDGDNALSSEEIQQIASQLSKLDRDGDGRVDLMELRKIFTGRRLHQQGEGRFERFEDDDFRRGGFGDRVDRRPGEGRRPGPPGRGEGRFERFEDDDFRRGGFEDRVDRRPGEGRRPGPPGQGEGRFERFEDDDFRRGGFEDRVDRRPGEGRRPGPPGQGEGRFERFEDDDFRRGSFEDRVDRRPGEGRRPGPPGRGEGRFERFEDDDFRRGGFEDRVDRRPGEGHRPGPPGRGEEAKKQDRGSQRLGRMVDQLYRYDANDDGALTAKELPARAKRLIEQADQDQNGSIDRNELEMFLQRR